MLSAKLNSVRIFHGYMHINTCVCVCVRVGLKNSKNKLKTSYLIGDICTLKLDHKVSYSTNMWYLRYTVETARR